MSSPACCQLIFSPSSCRPPAFVAPAHGDDRRLSRERHPPVDWSRRPDPQRHGPFEARRLAERARAELESIRERGGNRWASVREEPSHLRVIPYADKLVGDARRPLVILQAAVALVLLIVCVNTANLLLVRGWTRQREIAIRTAIGAGRGRVLRQFFVESLMLGAIGCAAGLLVARGLTAAMLRLLPLAVPRLSETTIDARVLAFALGACLATTFVFASVPAIACGRTISPTR